MSTYYRFLGRGGGLASRVLAGLLLLVAVTIVGCSKKKQSTDIIAPKVEAPKLQPPVKMQEYMQKRDVDWLDKTYVVEIRRTPGDSLPTVKDETGQQFVDNCIALRVVRADGSVFFSRVFTKADFVHLLDKDYRETGILEGLVFDKAEGNHLFFASSVCHPQTDEYIPLVVTVSNFGEVDMRLATQLDTNGGGTVGEDPADDDGV